MPTTDKGNPELFKRMLIRFEAAFDEIASISPHSSSDRATLHLLRVKYGGLKDRIAECLRQAIAVSSTQTEDRAFFDAFVVPCLRDIACSLRARRTSSGGEIAASAAGAHGELRWWFSQLK